MAGELIKILREKAGLTQTDLARKAGTSLSIVQKVEAGKAKGRRNTWRKLAEALDRSLESFDQMAAGDVLITVSRSSYDRFDELAKIEGKTAEELIAEQLAEPDIFIKKQSLRNGEAAKRHKAPKSQPGQSPTQSQAK